MMILIVGCGDLGRRLAERHRAVGDRVVCCSRSLGRCHALRQAGFETCRLDLDDPSTASGFDQPALAYMLAPPGGNGTYDPRAEMLLAILEPLGPPERLVYISTTGVYGDCGGEWVDESRSRQPMSARAMRRAAAEQQLEAWSSAQYTNLIILRVPGIYGPGRLPLERLHRREPVLNEAESPWSNHIHIEDLTRTAWLAGTHADASGIYNVSDGCPTSLTDYFNRVADACGLPRPPQISRTEAEKILTPGMLSFLNESRRIDNRRVLQSLGLKLRYPDLDSGLVDCIC